MSFLTMQTELRGSIPKLPIDFAATLVNRAWAFVRDNGLWSFQLFEGQWITPALFSTGTVTVTQGSPTATLDATAKAAFNANILTTGSYSLPTQRQFRVASSGTGIYHIWAYDGTAGTLTLDRPYGEFSLTGTPFSIYQCFYVPQASAATVSGGVLTVAPTYLSDFKSWITVRNQQNFIDLFTDRYNRAQLDAIDPQRSVYFFPTDVVPYENDQNPASATYGYFMYELWGNPTANYSYQLLGIRRMPDLAALTDTLPFAVGEDLIIAYAKYYAYEWAEANRDRGDRATRLYYTGPDFKFLMGAALKDAQRLLIQYRRTDRERVDNWFHVRRNAFATKIPSAYYNSVAGQANPGAGF
jgi:hypothetical protein